MTLALIGKTKKRRSALLLAAFFAIIVSTLGGLALRDSANASKPPDADPVGTIQVHKYVPKDNVNTPWKNEANVSFQFAVYDNAALTGTPLATFDQLGQPAKDLPQDKSLWLTELAKAGYTQDGYWIPDADNSSGNDKCVDPTSAILPWPLQITTEMWTTKGNQDGLFHVCAYNSPEPTERTIRIGKVTTTAAHPAVSFSGTYTGGTFNLLLAKDTLVGTPVAKTVGTGSITVVETTIPAKWTLAGYALVSDPVGTAVCSPEADYSLTANTVPAGTGGYLVCVLNEYNPGPILRSLAVQKVILSATPDPAVSFGGTVTGGLTWETTHGVADLVSDSLQPGSYVISEDAEPGYTLTGFAVYYGQGTCPAAPATTGSSATALLAGTNLAGTVCVYNTPVEQPASGTIVVVKVITTASGDTTTPFSGTLKSGGVDVVGSPFNDLTQGAAGAKVFGGLSMGTYELVETADLAAFTLLGYKEGSGTVAAPTCPAPSTYDSTISGTLANEGDVKVLCVYNEKSGFIHILKVVTNIEDSAWLFDVSIDGGPSHATNEISGSYWNPVAFGAHVVTEAPEAGYTTLGWAAITAGTTCPADMPTSTGGNVLAFGTDNTAEVTVAATDINATVVCFYNEQQQVNLTRSLYVEKVIIDVSPDNAITFNGTAASLPWQTTNSVRVHVSDELAEGSFSVTEAAEPGYILRGFATVYGAEVTCPTEPFTTAATGTADLTGDNVIATVCVYNEPQQVVVLRRLDVEKVIVGSSADNATHFTGVVDSQVNMTWETTNGVADSVSDTLQPGIYHVREDAKAGYELLGFATVYGGGASCPAGPTTTNYEGVATLNGGAVSAKVCVYNQPLVNIVVNKVEVTDRVASAGQGWKITLAGCGFTDTKTTAGQHGSVSWAGIPACTTYVVTEDTTSKPGLGFVAVTPTAVAVNANVAGQTYTVEFRNERNTYIPPLIIETPVPVVPTPTPVPPTPVPPTPVPPTVVPPTVPVDDVAGEKVSPTPAPPSAGTGTAANEEFPLSVFVLGGLLLAGSAMALVATTRRNKGS